MTLAKRALALLVSLALGAAPTVAEAGQRSASIRSPLNGVASVVSLGASISLPSIRLGELPALPNVSAVSVPVLNNVVPAPHAQEVLHHTRAGSGKVENSAAIPVAIRPTSIESALEPSAAAAPFEAIRQAAQDATGARIVDHARAQGFALEPVRADEVGAGGGLSAGSGSGSGLVPPGPPSGDDGARGEPPAPKPSRGPRGALGFLASLLVAQVGVETAGLAVPQLANQLAGSFQSASLLPTVAFLALTAGSLVGGAVVDKRGVKKTYLTLFALRAASAVALAWTGVAGGLTFPLLVALFGVDYFFLGATRVTEAVVPTALYKGRGQVAGFSNFAQMVIESMGVVGLAAGGLAIAAVGLHSALAAYAAAIVAASAVAFLALRKASFSAPEASGPSPSPREVWRALKELPRLRALGFAYVINVVLAAFLYFSVAPLFGLFAGASLGASATTFWTTALFAGGGFSATALGAWLNARRDRKLASATAAERDEAERASLERMAIGWSRGLAAVLLLGGWTLAAGAALGPLWALGFMFPFGLTAIMAYVALESMLKTEAPAALRGSIVGYAKAAAQLTAALSFPLIGWAFDALSGGAQTPSAAALGVIVAIFAAAALATLGLVRRK